MNNGAILITGTGAFAARIACDLAAMMELPQTVVLAGRNPQRLQHMVTMTNARARIFNRPVRFMARQVDLLVHDELAAMLEAVKPTVVVQAASTQQVSVLRSQQANAWTALVKNAGYGVTLPFQALISARVAALLSDCGASTRLVNCCFPDAVNPLIAARGHRVFAGIGNIALLTAVIEGSHSSMGAGSLRMLAHYGNLAEFRVPAQQRRGRPPRLWVGDQEIREVFTYLSSINLGPDPMPDVSAASAVPMIVATAKGTAWRGHLPGPLGLPGGYPVKVHGDALSLDLPAGLTEREAIAWNTEYAADEGIRVHDGHVAYTGRLRDALQDMSPELASGFRVTELEQAYSAMCDVRERLQQ